MTILFMNRVNFNISFDVKMKDDILFTFLEATSTYYIWFSVDSKSSKDEKHLPVHVPEIQIC